MAIYNTFPHDVLWLSYPIREPQVFKIKKKNLPLNTFLPWKAKLNATKEHGSIHSQRPILKKPAPDSKSIEIVKTGLPHLYQTEVKHTL